MITLMLKKKNDIKDMKRRNQTLILKTIYQQEVVSRAELAKLLGISKPAVNEHVDYLLQKMIIKEVGEGTSQKRGGRKPILIAPNRRYKYIVAVDLSFTKPLAALGNMMVPDLDKVSIDNSQNAGTLNMEVKSAIDQLLRKHQISHEDIGVIVVCSPGVVNEKNEIIMRNKQHEIFSNTDLFSFLSEEYGRPVLIKNDVNMAALAEKGTLIERGTEDFILFICGNGFGAGIILNGKLFEGRNNAAGEVGFFFDGDRSLEESITMIPLLQRVQKETKMEHLKFADVLEAYERNDPIVIKILKEIGHKLGICANNCAVLLDLDMVLLGGEYLIFQEILIPEMKAVIGQSGHMQKPEVLPASLGYDSGIIGCMTIARDYLIDHLE